MGIGPEHLAWSGQMLDSPVTPEGAHLQLDAISVPLNLRSWFCLHRTFQNQLSWGQANHRAGPSGSYHVGRSWSRGVKRV